MTLGSHQRSIGKKQEHFTPRFLWEPLGRFATDAATGDWRPWTIGAVRNLTPRENSLAMDWSGFGRTWLNPPFDRRVIGAFVAKMCEHNFGTMLIHVRTETAWWRQMNGVAAGFLWLAQRVVFCKADGSPCTIEKPTSKYFGKPANSGAPVVLVAFGFRDLDALYDSGIEGEFDPRLFPRFVIAAMIAGSWRDELAAWLSAHAAPVSTKQLYEFFRNHPKARGRKHWRAQIRKVLQQGPFEPLGNGMWRAA